MAIQDEKNIPKSRVTLRYRTEINGVSEDITLPLRILVAADFSGFDSGGENKGTFGERDLENITKRASIEKRQIFNARDIMNLEVKKDNGEKLSESEYYNSVFQRLNVPFASGTVFDEDFYKELPYKRAGAIKKVDDFNPNLFDFKTINEAIGEKKEQNNNISTFLSKLGNDRSFYNNIRGLIKVAVGATPLDPDVTDFYDNKDNAKYIRKLTALLDLSDQIGDFDNAVEKTDKKLFTFFKQLEDFKVAGAGDKPLTLTRNEKADAYIGITEDEIKSLGAFDQIVTDLPGVDDEATFFNNATDSFKPNYENIIGDENLKSFAERKELKLYEPELLHEFKFLESVNAFTFDYTDPTDGSLVIGELKTELTELQSKNDQDIAKEIDKIIRDPAFKSIESSWRALEYLVKNTDFSKDIRIDFIDIAKSELAEDFTANRTDIPNSFFFKRVYTQEYDQYGGQPFSAIIGLYEFENTKKDRDWLATMGRISNLAHCPFISSVGPKFFVGEDDIFKLSDIRNLSGHMAQPQFDDWNEFRDTEQAAYLGFTVPRFMIRRPYDVTTNPAGDLKYTENMSADTKLGIHNNYCWGNSAILFAHNLVKSFEETSWCQTIRGPKNGGYIEHLPRHIFEIGGLTLEKAPVEIVLPDYRELDFAKSGFMALVNKKNTSSACFFSCQSIKLGKKFKDDNDTKNSQMVSNLAYTLSITKIAHYIKCIMRDNIGGSADAAFISKVINSWLNNYVTTVVNPDDLTLRRYPFKAISVETVEREAEIGWYDCKVKVLPHIQFEGLETELQLETRLGTK